MTTHSSHSTQPTLSINVIILAAGMGKRMGSPLPKVLHTVGRRSMLCHVIDTAIKMRAFVDVAQIGIVHGPDHIDAFTKDIETELPELIGKIRLTEQTERLGTGHAVQSGLPMFDNTLPLLVLFGDQPLMGASYLAAMAQKLNENDLCLSAFDSINPHGFGRLIRNPDGTIASIVEEKDANESERAITLCNAGVMALGARVLPLLAEIQSKNAAEEYYLTDLVALSRQKDFSIQHVSFPRAEMALVNTLVQLSEAEALWQQQARQQFLLQGVQMQAPDTVYFSVDTEIAAGCYIEPNVVFGRNVRIGESTRILAFSHLEAVTIGQECQIGPFARIRPNSILGDDVKIGNFVEVKNSHILSHTRANHHAYLGDCYIEQKVNIGAGTISCNYDGKFKHVTHIGENAFIGTNSSLVAPLHIGKNTIVGAGSVIADNIEDGDMALERNKQLNIKNGANRFRERQQS